MFDIGTRVVVQLPFHSTTTGVIVKIIGSRCMVKEDESTAQVLTSLSSLEVA